MTTERELPEYLDAAFLRGLTQRRITRRTALAGASAISLGAFLAACGIGGNQAWAFVGGVVVAGGGWDPSRGSPGLSLAAVMGVVEQPAALSPAHMPSDAQATTPRAFLVHPGLPGFADRCMAVTCNSDGTPIKRYRH